MCSDDGCEAVFEALGPLEEVEALACECGCSLQVLAWPEPAGDAETVVLELVA